MLDLSGIPDLFASMTSESILNQDLKRLLNHRGLLRHVANECGTDYKRLHELITEQSEPRHSLGKVLEDWITCASLLAATRADLIGKRPISFLRLLRLLELKESLTSPFLKMKIEGVVELLGPVAKRTSPSKGEVEAAIEREQAHQQQGKALIDSSISSLVGEIDELLKK